MLRNAKSDPSFCLELYLLLLKPFPLDIITRFRRSISEGVLFTLSTLRRISDGFVLILNSFDMVVVCEKKDFIFSEPKTQKPQI